MQRLLVIVLVIMLALVVFYFTASAAVTEVVEGYTATLSYASSNASVYAKYAADNYLRTITTPDEHASELADIELYALAKQYGVTLPRDLSEKRKAVLKAAFSGVTYGIPYYWDCRDYSVVPGLEGNNFGEELGKPDYRNRTKKGLDCSSFVGWAYYTAGITWCEFANGGDAESGYTFKATPWMRAAASTTEIEFKDIQPGDIAFISNGAAGSDDHTGIYLGNNEQGIAIWIHCSSGGAICSTYSRFKVFYIVKDMED